MEMQEKETIIRLKDKMQLLERANTSAVLKINILTKMKCTNQLSNHKRPEGPQKTTKVHDDRTIFTVKKKTSKSRTLSSR